MVRAQKGGISNPIHMKLSVITPVYNEPRISETLESVLSQQGVGDIEVIVVDGGSTDQTVTIIDQYANEIDVLIQEPDEGLYDAMNKGIENATGDIVGILNADDRYQHTEVLRSVVDAFNRTDTDLCYGNLVYVDGDDEVVRYWNSGEYQSKRFYYGWMPPHPTVFVKQEVYEQYEPFDVDLQIAGDYELLLRLLLCHDLSATWIDDVLVRMALGGKSNESVTNVLRANWEVYRAWRKNGLRGGIHVPIIKPLRKIPQFINDGIPDT